LRAGGRAGGQAEAEALLQHHGRAQAGGWVVLVLAGQVDLLSGGMPTKTEQTLTARSFSSSAWRCRNH
jgi:hypothetical protein